MDVFQQFKQCCCCKKHLKPLLPSPLHKLLKRHLSKTSSQRVIPGDV
uniref:Uncharacterized protein n=1 Tax=Parascaris equorum TaxID=6256 RepID=A0A914RIG3_PAREQ